MGKFFEAWDIWLGAWDRLAKRILQIPFAILILAACPILWAIQWIRSE